MNITLVKYTFSLNFLGIGVCHGRTGSWGLRETFRIEPGDFPAIFRPQLFPDLTA